MPENKNPPTFSKLPPDIIYIKLAGKPYNFNLGIIKGLDDEKYENLNIIIIA